MEDNVRWLKDVPRPNWFGRIKLQWNFKWKYTISDIRHGIKNLWYWIPIVWKDRNWQYNYTLSFMKHKLELLAKDIKKRDIIVGADWVHDRAMLCARLIDKVDTEFYKMEYTDYVEDQMGFRPIEGSDELSELVTKRLEDNLDDYFKKYQRIYNRVIQGGGYFDVKDENGEVDRQSVAINISHMNHERAKRLLFTILDRNIEYFWD